MYLFAHGNSPWKPYQHLKFVMTKIEHPIPNLSTYIPCLCQCHHSPHPPPILLFLSPSPIRSHFLDSLESALSILPASLNSLVYITFTGAEEPVIFLKHKYDYDPSLKSFSTFHSIHSGQNWQIPNSLCELVFKTDLPASPPALSCLCPPLLLYPRIDHIFSCRMPLHLPFPLSPLSCPPA